MGTHVSTTDTSPLSNAVVSRMRTFVPVAWGALVGWLLTVIPGLPEPVETFLRGQTELVVALVIGLWYLLWRWLEPRLPDILKRVLLGSAASPKYAKLTQDGAVVITDLPPATAADGVLLKPSGAAITLQDDRLVDVATDERPTA